MTELEQAQRLAEVLWEKHWKVDSPNWRVAETFREVLLQIDNMTAGLERKK